MAMKSVKDCDSLSNCVFHFPQFRRYTEEMLHETLDRVIHQSKVEYNGKYTRNEQYFKFAYKNWEFLTAEYVKIRAMPFMQACEVICDLIQREDIKQHYIRPDLYLDLQGGVAEFCPCCK